MSKESEALKAEIKKISKWLTISLLAGYFLGCWFAFATYKWLTLNNRGVLLTVFIVCCGTGLFYLGRYLRKD